MGAFVYLWDCRTTLNICLKNGDVEPKIKLISKKPLKFEQ